MLNDVLTVGSFRQHPLRANEEEIIKLVEAAVAAREAKASLSANPERKMEQGAANGDGEHHNIKGNRSKVSSAARIDHPMSGRRIHVRRIQTLAITMREMAFNLYFIGG